MFGISGTELIIIFAVAVLIFGPEEMPRIGRTIGRALRMFNDARQQVESVVTSEILNPEDAHLLKDPFGLKGMTDDFQKSIAQLGDPSYKPAPKGAGMRVSSDDQFDVARAKERSQAAVPADTSAEAIIVEEGTSNHVTSQTQEVRDVDPQDAASIWGVKPTADSVAAEESVVTSDAC